MFRTDKGPTKCGMDNVVSMNQHKFGIDYLTEQNRNQYKNIGRNDLCPCGSGKKYKKCCL